MPLDLTLITRCYFLPEDGDEAKQEFLGMLHDPQETYIAAYGFTLTQLIDEIIAADKAGVAVHILLDHLQATGHSEAPLVKHLHDSLTCGDLTITTAGPGGHSSSQIWHWKGMVVGSKCWYGSVNFSDSGWNQGNGAQLFDAPLWASRFIEQFKLHRAWALANEPQYQVGAKAACAAPAEPSAQVQPSSDS